MRPRRIRRGSDPSRGPFTIRVCDAGASMRPRRIRRGSAGTSSSSSDVRSAAIASMRPRRIRRGSHSRASQSSGLRASMRPRRIRRGSLEHRWRARARRRLRFNEAPANSPGIGSRPPCGPRRIDRRNGFRFNEAPANSPGIGRPPSSRRKIERRHIAASMRPRRIRRGSAVAGFNEVPPRLCIGASMRPRRIRRGSHRRLDGIDQLALEASMRPRRIRRGSGVPAARATGSFEAPANSRRRLQ